MDVEVFVEGEGAEEIEIIRIQAGSERRVIVEQFAERHGLPVGETVLFAEDEDEPLDLAFVITDQADVRRPHHIHRVQRIDVTVFYKNEERSRSFSPSARVQKVLDWAVGTDGFKIDPVIAPEMELAIHGQEKPLAKNAHIGRFVVHGQHKLALDLIRGIVPNGASQ
jgi:hypothetical protein